MRGRWTALGLALALSLVLPGCGAQTAREIRTDRLSGQGESRTELPAHRDRDTSNGRYYAGADGRVARGKETGESEWEKLGRELRDSWDSMMDSTERAARDLERDAREAARETEHRA